MDKLTKCTRNGRDSYCFIQVKEVLFPTVPKSTVKSWLRELKITCKHCTAEEYLVFKNAIPGLSGAFGTIESTDLWKLIELSQHKKIAKGHLMPTSIGSPRPETETTKSGRTYLVEDSKLDVIVLDKPDISPQSTNDRFGHIAQTLGVGVSSSSTKGEIGFACSAVSLHKGSVCTATITKPIATAVNTSPPNNMNINRTYDFTGSAVSSCKDSICTATNTNSIAPVVNTSPKNMNIASTYDFTGSAVSPHKDSICTATNTNSIAAAVNTSPNSMNVTSTDDLTASAVYLHKGTTVIAHDVAKSDISFKHSIVKSAPTTPITSSSCDHEGNGGKLNNRTDESPRKRYTLAPEHISAELREELRQLNEFYTSDINLSRDCCKLTDTTMTKINERIMCFLGFVKIYSPFERLSLNLASNLKFLGEYVKYLTNVRKLMASTVSRNLSAILSALKYTQREMPDLEKLPEVIAIRNMQRQLAREEELTRKRKREGFSTSTKNEALLFSHILDVMRQLRDQYYTTSGITSSRYLHDFVLLCLYTRALPGRGKELRTLQLIDHTTSERQFQADSVEELNALHFQSDGSVTLTEVDFKTVKTMGPSKIDLTDDEWLVYFIKIYAQKYRPTLLLGKNHKYFFVNKIGDAFLSSAAFSKYISDLFDREIGIRASTNKMRHAICTHFMSLPESQNQKLRESLAALLKHSVRHQQDTYNDQRRHERVQMSRSFMRKQLVEKDLFEIEGNEMCVVQDSKNSLASQESNSEDLLPQIGELVALLDPASTGPDNAFIFIAKVLRYTPDKDRVYLQELEKLNDSCDLYRAKCSSTWWENVQTLCYPIDIVYISCEKAYQLRTTAKQIYHDIKSN